MSHSEPDPLVVASAIRAIKAAGGSAKLGRAINVGRNAVHGWKTAGIPPARVPIVARITGIPLHELRPDLFDAPPEPTPTPRCEPGARETAEGVA